MPETNFPENKTYWWKDLIRVHPDWAQVTVELGWLWELHIYILGTLFVILTCTAFFALISIRPNASSKAQLSSLNGFLCALGITRSIVLFVDPYGSRKFLPDLVTNIIWDMAFPCLLSSFALLHLAFIQMTQLQVSVEYMNKPSFITFVMILHFCLIIISNIFWSIKYSLRIIWLLIQISFSIWGLFLCLSFMNGCLRLLRSINKLPPTIYLSNENDTTEIKDIFNLGKMAGNQSPAANMNFMLGGRSLMSAYKPKIRITDENEQTFSYHSETPSTQPNATDSDDSGSRSASPSVGEYECHSSSQRCTSSRRSSGNSNPNQIHQIQLQSRSPKRVRKNSQETEDDRTTSITDERFTIRSFDKKTPKLRGNTEVVLPEPARNKSTDKRSKIEKLLRKVILAASLGTIVSIFQLYDVVGPHGVFATNISEWFCFSTVYRIMELFLSFIMSSITKQSFNTNSSSERNKRRDIFT